jgi:hypothetical protein
MLKKLVEKRIAQFKVDFPEFKVSKKGNLYYAHNETSQRQGMEFNVFNVTKGTLNKLGEHKEWHKSTSDYTVLITQSGKLMIKYRKKPNFKLVTMKDVRKVSTLTDCFMIGRKFEYLTQYPSLKQYNFFQGFNSLREAKVFLGYGFISDTDFYSLFPKSNGFHHRSNSDFFRFIIITPDKYKSNIVSLIKNNSDHRTLFMLLTDYHNMADSLGMEKVVPRSFNRLRELHDNAVLKVNERQADKYTNEVEASIESVREDGTTFEDDWKTLNIKFSKLDTQRKLFLEGIKQKHCLGSYTDRLDSFSFYSLYWDDKPYNIQIAPSGNLRQFYGYRNCQPPKELRELVYDKNIDYTHKINHKNNEVQVGLDYVSSINCEFPTSQISFQAASSLAFIDGTIQAVESQPQVELILRREFSSLTSLDSNKIYVVQNDDGSVHSIMMGSQEICPTTNVTQETLDNDDGVDSIWSI